MTAAKPTVYEAWSHVMAAVQSVGKTGRNTQQNYNFRGIDAVVNAAGPATREHGVLVMPSLLDAQYRDIQVGQNRTPMREVTVRVRYTIFGPAGDVLTIPGDPDFGVVPGESMDSGDKGTAKAMSVAYRIFLLQALMIPTDEPDPDVSSYERSEPEATIPAASKDQIAAVKSAAADLTDAHWNVVQAWTKQRNLPEPDRLNTEQADAVLAYIAEVVADADDTPGAATELRQRAEEIAAMQPAVKP